MKISLKKLLLLLTVAVILVSTLPISASAADGDTYQIRCHLATSSGLTDEQNAALSDISFYFEESDSLNLLSKYGTTYSITQEQGSLIVFYNNSNYDITLGLAHNPGGKWNTFCYFTIPARGSYNLSSSEFEFLSSFDSSELIYLFAPAAYPPVFVPDSGSDPGTDYNVGCYSFYAQLPHGENVFLGQVRPPSDHVGVYTFNYASIMDSFELDDWQLEALDGYVLDSSKFDINAFYLMYDDDVAEIRIPYCISDGSARTLRFELYSADGLFLKYEVVKVSSSVFTCNTPIYGEYDTFPYSVDVDITKPLDEVQVFKCYVVNILEIMNDSYDRGYKDGFALGVASSPDAGDAWQEGYDKGLDDGLKQNKLTAEQIQHYTKDYNAITAFFDGMFRWMKNMFFDLGEGIQFKGISALEIFSSVLIIAVVIWGYKVLF